MFSPDVLPLFIDVRSPSEYRHGAIVGAVNIPLFSDEERARVGTLYKTVGSDEAKDVGLAIASGKLSDIVNRVKELNCRERPIVVYCWRGGMRSKSLVMILDLMGIQAYQLSGGYKAYRNQILNKLQKFPLKPRIAVLCGSTGVGKTTLLAKLAARGQAMIDLEQLANHRGSAFGHLGLGKPATAQNFDAHLLGQLQSMNTEPYIVVECESKRIGNVYLPDFFHQAMQQGIRILVTASIKTRTRRLMDEYMETGPDLTDAVFASLESLRKRLGNHLTNTLRDNFLQGQIADMVEQLLLHYYDPLYGYETAGLTDFDYCVCAENLDEAADQIIAYIKQGGNANAIFG
ncbi:tRNA 2-selenouridine synthase [Acetonema longum DSM 6540]|uniref:tRNA 2-selenouridine synthase n=2 Tax=Acetonema TaxID=2373 RepID=F7NPE9_9FIRM|nr:tRNA 2-selenouridine synthase [Acetonema longum DSM 6540]